MAALLDVNFADDPLVAGLSDAAFRLLVESAVEVSRVQRDWYSGEHYPTDFLPWCFVASGDAFGSADELVAAGIWSVREWQEQPGFGVPTPRRGPSRPVWRRRHIAHYIRAIVYARDGYQCVTCGTSEHLSLDHIHPRSRGGTDDPSNLQTMCRPCNSRKGARV